jgi:hypothetical protein
MGLGDEDAVVDLVDAEGDFVFGLLGAVAGGGEVGSGDVVGGLDFEEFGERLGERGAADDERFAALVEDCGALRDGCSAYGAEASLRDADELGVGDLEEVAVVAEDGVVGAAGDVFGVLFFFDFVGGDADDVVVFQGHLDGFFEGDVARSG